MGWALIIFLQATLSRIELNGLTYVGCELCRMRRVDLHWLQVYLTFFKYGLDIGLASTYRPPKLIQLILILSSAFATSNCKFPMDYRLGQTKTDTDL